MAFFIIQPTQVKSQIIQEYAAEYEFNSVNNHTIRTESFIPIPNVDVEFCFDITYEGESWYSFLNIVLVKLNSSEISPLLKLKVDLIVSSVTGCKRMDFSSNYVAVKDMNSIVCINELNSEEANGCASPRPQIFRDGIIMKSKLVFGDNIDSPSEHSLNILKTFTRDFMNIYEPCLFSDIAIQIGKETLCAHKSVLCAHSPVFMKITHDFVEQKDNTIVITDCEIDIFKCFLRYLYSGEIEDKSFIALRDLYVLADKYNTKTLKRQCQVEIIKYHLTLNEICEILRIAYEYNDGYLKQETKKFASNNFQYLVSKAEWTALTASHALIGHEVYSAHLNT